MYSVVLAIHSWARWVTLLLAVGATISAARRPIPTTGACPASWWDTLFMLAIDLQVLVGILLYFGLSPFTKHAMENMGAAMREPSMRFWAFWHVAGMAVAFVLVRMGRVLAVNSASPATARNRRVMCFALATLAMVASIPWPGLANGRPLFRL
jgi:hypothetical protein